MKKYNYDIQHGGVIGTCYKVCDLSIRPANKTLIENILYSDGKSQLPEHSQIGILNTFLKNYLVHDNEKHIINDDLLSSFMENISIDINGILINSASQTYKFARDNCIYNIVNSFDNPNTNILFMTNKTTGEKKVMKIFKKYSISPTNIQHYISLGIKRLSDNPTTATIGQKNYINVQKESYIKEQNRVHSGTHGTTLFTVSDRLYNDIKQFTNPVDLDKIKLAFQQAEIEFGNKVTNFSLYKNDKPSCDNLHLFTKNMDPINDFLVNSILRYVSNDNIKSNIIEYHNLIIIKYGNDYKYAIIMEQVDGDLKGLLKSSFEHHGDPNINAFKSMETIDSLINKIFYILGFLKKSCIFTHTDLKMENIFYKKNTNGEIIPLLADFDKSSVTFHHTRFVPTISDGPAQYVTDEQSLLTSISASIAQYINFSDDGFTLKQTKSSGVVAGVIDADQITMRYSSTPFCINFDYQTIILSYILHCCNSFHTITHATTINRQEFKNTLIRIIASRVNFFYNTDDTFQKKIIDDISEFLYNAYDAYTYNLRSTQKIDSDFAHVLYPVRSSQINQDTYTYFTYTFDVGQHQYNLKYFDGVPLNTLHRPVDRICLSETQNKLCLSSAIVPEKTVADSIVSFNTNMNNTMKEYDKLYNKFPRVKEHFGPIVLKNKIRIDNCGNCLASSAADLAKTAVVGLARMATALITSSSEQSNKWLVKTNQYSSTSIASYLFGYDDVDRIQILLMSCFFIYYKLFYENVKQNDATNLRQLENHISRHLLELHDVAMTGGYKNIEYCPHNNYHYKYKKYTNKANKLNEVLQINKSDKISK